MFNAPDYREFLAAKSQLGGDAGFAPVWLPDFLFDFQRHLVEWALRKGRAAIFADCGLGKTPMQLAWAENIVRQTNGRALILTPLAVAAQTVREDEKHVHPLQLDVIDRAVQMRTNAGETVLTPFMGVGSEVYALCYGRRAIGIELKQSYYRQALRNIRMVKATGGAPRGEQGELFDRMAAAE